MSEKINFHAFALELWFDEQTVIAFPDGWQSPRRFVLNEIEFVAQS